MSMFNAPRYISVFVILIFNVTKREATERNCSSFWDCGGRPCCRVSNKPLIKVCSNNCVGKACLHAYDCGGHDLYSMCCRNNVCTNDIEMCSCKSVHDPICRRNGKYCCKERLTYRIRTCKKNCEHHPCTNNDECAKGECCNSNNMCSPDCSYLRECRTDSDCTHTLKCCDFKPSYKTESIKACKYTCSKRCVTNDDCTDQCCGSDKLCIDCNPSPYSWTTFIIIACTMMFIIICAALVLTCYCRRRGRCVLFKPRGSVDEETFQLRSESENDSSVQNNPSDQNLPPPPYSTDDQPFPPSQNQEFPPIYMPQET
jgi:hypothetical protein